MFPPPPMGDSSRRPALDDEPIEACKPLPLELELSANANRGPFPPRLPPDCVGTPRLLELERCGAPLLEDRAAPRIGCNAGIDRVSPVNPPPPLPPPPPDAISSNDRGACAPPLSAANFWPVYPLLLPLRLTAA